MAVPPVQHGINSEQLYFREDAHLVAIVLALHPVDQPLAPAQSRLFLSLRDPFLGGDGPVFHFQVLSDQHSHGGAPHFVVPGQTPH